MCRACSQALKPSSQRNIMEHLEEGLRNQCLPQSCHIPSGSRGPSLAPLPPPSAQVQSVLPKICHKCMKCSFPAVPKHSSSFCLLKTTPHISLSSLSTPATKAAWVSILAGCFCGEEEEKKLQRATEKADEKHPHSPLRLLIFFSLSKTIK